MIRGIDTQMMIQQTINVAKFAGERVADTESRKEFKAQLERERVVKEENSVVDLEKAEYRRVEREKDEQHEKDEYTDQEARMLWSRRKLHAEEDEEQQTKPPEAKSAEKERLFAGGVGFEIDIDA